MTRQSEANGESYKSQGLGEAPTIQTAANDNPCSRPFAIARPVSLMQSVRGHSPVSVSLHLAGDGSGVLPHPRRVDAGLDVLMGGPLVRLIWLRTAHSQFSRGQAAKTDKAAAVAMPVRIIPNAQ